MNLYLSIATYGKFDCTVFTYSDFFLKCCDNLNMVSLLTFIIFLLIYDMSNLTEFLITAVIFLANLLKCSLC